MTTVRSQPLKYGHIAGTIRDALKQQGMTGNDLARKLGCAQTNPNAWMNAKCAPGANIRPRLAKILHIPEEDLMVRDRVISGIPPAHALTPYVSMSRGRPAEVFSFAVNNEGDAHIKLDAVLPVTQAMQVLRLLMDAGLVAPRSSGNGHDQSE